MNYFVALPRQAFLFGNNDGVSTSSQEVSNQLRKVQSDISNTITYGMKLFLLPKVLQIKSDCNQDNWDGHDASIVEKETISAALMFINMLPEGIIQPEVTAESTGAISFEWQTERELCFSVSVFQNGLYYAGLLGQEKIHGEINTFHSIPEKIVSILYDNFIKR